MRLLLVLLLMISLTETKAQTRDSISKQQQLDRIKKEKLRNPVSLSSQGEKKKVIKKKKKKKHHKKRHPQKRNSTFRK